MTKVPKTVVSYGRGLMTRKNDIDSTLYSEDAPVAPKRQSQAWTLTKQVSGFLFKTFLGVAIVLVYAYTFFSLGAHVVCVRTCNSLDLERGSVSTELSCECG
jgi:hypothetical protein